MSTQAETTEANGADTEAAPPALEAEVLKIATETLTGDLRDSALQWIRALEKPWPQLTERMQRDVIESVSRGAVTAASRAVEVIAAANRPTIKAELEQYVEKDGLKVTLKALATEENVIALHRAKGCRVHIVAGDVAPFVGQREDAKPDPDQGSLPGTDGAAAEEEA